MKILFRIQTVSGNPKSEIQNPRSKIQNPSSKIQNPNGPFGFWILEFGFWIWGGRAGAGGDGYAANDVVWPVRPPEIGSRLGSPHARSKLGTGFRRRVLLETEPRFPAPCRGNRGSISRETTGKPAGHTTHSRSSTLRLRAPKQSNELHAAVFYCHSR